MESNWIYNQQDKIITVQNTFGSFPDNGTGTFSMYNTPSSRSHSHDGFTAR